MVTVLNHQGLKYLDIWWRLMSHLMGFPGGSDSKESTYNAGDLGSIPGLRRSPAEENGNPLQYSCQGNPMDYTVHRILQARILEWASIPFSRGSSQPRDWTWVSCIVGGFFTIWATREAQEYWSGYQIFPSQEPNLGLLHCRWILYKLSYQGSPTWLFKLKCLFSS